MRIESLTLQNFRCFEKRTFAFAPGFNVCVGDNGTGKTALLDALCIAVGAFLAGFDLRAGRDVVDEDVRRVTLRHNSTVTLERVGDLVVESRGRFRGLGSFPTRGRAGSATSSEPGIVWSRKLGGAKRGTPRAGALSPKKLTALVRERVAKGEPIVLPVVAFHGTGRLWWSLYDKKTHTEASGPVSRLSGYTRCLDPASDHKGFARWMKRLELRQLQEGVTIAELESVRAVARDAIPGCTDLRYLVNDDELVATMSDGRSVPVSMLSDGQRTVLGLVTDLARRCVVLNPHLGLEAAARTPGIVLIDEIDLHLHPTWQRRIVGDLRRLFPEVQFVATTHSPFIVQSLRAGELINLDDLAGSHVNESIENIAEDVMGVDRPQRSREFLEMMAAADEYYRVLDEAALSGDHSRLEVLKQRLDELSERYPTEPAYGAFLRTKRLARRLPGDPEA